MTNVYSGARDATGNSCLKAGASSKAGSFSFTVSDDVVKVIIYVAKYKTNTTKVSVNGTNYTISGASNSGVYDEIIVDTSTNKTITIKTLSGGYRAMINTILFRTAGEKCEHTFDDAATCTTAQRCTTCGIINEAEKGHTNANAVEENRTEATCTATGSYDSVVYCSVCNDEISRETKIIEKLSHTESEWIVDVEATENADGSQHKECTACGQTLETEIIPALSHECNYTEIVVTAPTCTQAGYTTYTCECGEFYTDNEVSATGHNYESVVTLPTCAEDGYTTYTCSVCTHSYTADPTDATGEHKYVDGYCECGKKDPNAKTTVTVSVATYASSNGWTNEKQYKSITVDNNITASVTGGGNTGKYYTNGNNWRLYQTESAKITITAANGKTIQSIKITYSVTNTGTLKNGSTAISSGTTVIVNGSSITLTVGNTGTKTNGQVRITAIEVIYS